MSLLAFRRDRLDQLVSGKFAPAPSSTVVVYRAGAQVKGNQGPVTSLTVLPGHFFPSGGGVSFCVMRYSGGTWAMVASSMRAVSSSTQTSIVFAGAITVLDGDYLVNIGNDLGGGAPLFTASTAVVYPNGDDTGTPISQSRITPNAQGEYSYYSQDRNHWELVVTGTTPSELRLATFVGPSFGTSLPASGSFPGDEFVVQNPAAGDIVYRWLRDSSGAYHWEEVLQIA